MAETTITEIMEAIAARAERGRDLLVRRRALIVHVDDDTYKVPADTGRKTYTVRYGGDVEECTCTDYGVNQGRLACKHLQAIGLMHAIRRRAPSRGCEVCGTHERIISRRGDRRRDAERWCLPHHPESLARVAQLRVAEADIQGTDHLPPLSDDALTVVGS